MTRRDIRVCLAVVLCAIGMLANGAQARTVRTVNAAGPGTTPPWNTAVTSLHTALAASLPGDEIWIAAGTYTPNLPNPGPATFTIPSGVRVFGGFAGTETTAAQRSPDLAQNVTVLLGGPSLSPPVYHIVTASGTNSQTLLDRCTIRGGFGGGGNGRGAGMFMSAGNVTVSNCRFEQNHSWIDQFSPGLPGAPGGAVYMDSTSAPTFTGCVFDSNSARDGIQQGCFGGSAQYPGGHGGNGGAVAAFASSPTFTECAFTNNIAGNGGFGASCSLGPNAGGSGGSGGAVYAENSALSFVGCLFASNAAGFGRGGGSWGGNATPNGNGGAGGAVALSGGTASFTSCILRSNASGKGASQNDDPGYAGYGLAGGNGGPGGAISCDGTALTVVSSAVFQNTSGNGGNGNTTQFPCTNHSGGSTGAGGIDLAGAATLILIGSTVAYNTPGTPGTTPSSGSCTPAPPATGGVGGVSCTGSTAIVGSILWGNANGQLTAPAPDVTYTDFQGGFAGTGNIDSDPLFVNAAAGDFHLPIASPCIDAGSNSAIPAGDTTDADGRPRIADPTATVTCNKILDTDTGAFAATAADPVVDMGAYELQGNNSDCNNNGICDTLDVTGVQVLHAPSPATGDLFAWSTSVFGDTAFIGARGSASGKGAAYAYSLRGATWGSPQTLSPADLKPDDDFGNAVAVGDHWAAVGARNADLSGKLDAGAVYVYANSGSAWAQNAKLTASDGKAGNMYGSSVAVDGDRIAVGAPKGDKTKPDGGEVYMYRYKSTNNTWVEEAKLAPKDAATGKGFGICVSLSGGTLAVGAPYDTAKGTGAGAVYIFTLSGTSWSQTAKIFPTEAASLAAANFGELVSVSGDRILASAAHLTYSGQSQAGAAYIFKRTVTGTGAHATVSWPQEMRLISDSPQAGELFGFGLTLDGTQALIGGSRRTVSGVSQAGAAYLFRLSGSAWPLAERIDSIDPQASGFFGYSVGLSGNHAIIGGYQQPSQSFANTGSARVFDLSVLDANHDGIPDSCQGSLLAYTAGSAPVANCRGDFNRSGSITAQDMFDYLDAWLAHSPRARLNAPGAATTQDLFDFIAAFFAGCP